MAPWRNAQASDYSQPHGAAFTGVLAAPLPRSAFVVILLAPLAGISLVVLAGIILLAGTPWVNLLALYGAANVAMASGDIWILSVLLRYPATAKVIDARDGVVILLPAEADTQG